MDGGEKIIAVAKERAGHVESMLGEDFDLLTADRRYGYINGVVRQVTAAALVDRATLTDRIDNVVTHKWLGLPVFLAVMYFMFRLVIDVSAPFLDWIDAVINGPVSSWLSLASECSFCSSLAKLIDHRWDRGWGGRCAGRTRAPGAVFLPGSARGLRLYVPAAFVMDRFMHRGSARQIVHPDDPGFGCAVPAVYATRTIASRRDRVLTALLVPSCPARRACLSTWCLAWLSSDPKPGRSSGRCMRWESSFMLAGMVFLRPFSPDVSSAFVLELPPYRQPALKSVLIHMWENTSGFIRKAGTTILMVSVVMWFL